jgi:hypothetical protein
MKNVVLIILSLFLASASFASSGLKLGEPSYGGSGCPAGSAAVVLSSDQKSLSLLFDQYMAEVGFNGKKIDRKSCNVAIPVHVPQGFSVSIFKTDFRGYVSVPRGGYARFNAEYFFAGEIGPKFTKTFRSRYEDEYLFTNLVTTATDIWSGCGEDVILRANTSMLVKTNSRYDDALGTVDSADMTSGIVYHIKWKKCGSTAPSCNTYKLDECLHWGGGNACYSKWCY